MMTMQQAGIGRPLPPHVRVHEDGHDYVVEVDVVDFLPEKLTVEVVGRVLTVRVGRAPLESHTVAIATDDVCRVHADAAAI